MPRTRFKTEEIIQKLGEVAVLLWQGRNVSEACRQIGVTDNTYYRWRKRVQGHPERSGKASESAGAGEYWFEEAGGRGGTGQDDSSRSRIGKLLIPAKQRQAVDHARGSSGRIRV